MAMHVFLDGSSRSFELCRRYNLGHMSYKSGCASPFKQK